VGIVDLVDCVNGSDDPGFEGPWGWVVEGARPLAASSEWMPGWSRRLLAGYKACLAASKPVAIEYIIYCDESASKGKYFSNFYGGILVRSTDLEYVRMRLQAKKAALNLKDEVKWQKVSHAYQKKYVALVDEVFDLLAADRIKIRVMFTQNMHVPTGLSQTHIEDQYFILYYQFLKHAFGLPHSNADGNPIRVRLNLDQLPENRERANRFKSYLCGLSTNRDFERARIEFDRDNIADVVSHDHDILQVLDVILGAIQFRLNDKHLEKPEGKKRRGKRTLAKQKLYKHINRRIQGIHHRQFNVGTSTSDDGDPSNRWKHPYRHWLFRPKRRQTIVGRGKPRNR
jgi:hypothetical protein